MWGSPWAGASPLLSQAFGAGNHVRVGIVLTRILAIHAVISVLVSLPLTAAAGPPPICNAACNRMQCSL